MAQRQQHKVSNYDTSRRVFRGRSGATDRTTILDKSILLSKRKPKKYTGVPEVPEVVSNYCESDLIIKNDKPCTSSSSNDDDDNNNSHDNNGSSKNCLAVTIQQKQENLQDETSLLIQQQSINDNTTTTTTIIYIKRNINKLLNRIGNVRRSIQHSSTATISQSNVYKENVIFAVQNCCITWSNLLIVIILQNQSHSIQEQQQEYVENDSTDINNDPGRANNTIINNYDDWIKIAATKVALQLFTLIQLSLQCGPLHGCKPGYFKRCGYDICSIVLHYMQTIQQYYYCNRKKNSDRNLLIEQQQQQVESEDTQTQENVMGNTVLEEAETESLVPMQNVNDSEHSSHDDDDDDDDDNKTSDDDCIDYSILSKKNNMYTIHNDDVNAVDDDDDATADDISDDDEVNETYATTGISDNNDNNNQADRISTNDNTTRSKNERCWDYLYFTTNQIYTIDKWIHDCSKKVVITRAATSTGSNAALLPSRHIQGLQYQGVQNTIKNKQRRQKKQQQKSNAVEISKKKDEYIVHPKKKK